MIIKPLKAAFILNYIIKNVNSANIMLCDYVLLKQSPMAESELSQQKEMSYAIILLPMLASRHLPLTSVRSVNL